MKTRSKKVIPTIILTMLALFIVAAVIFFQFTQMGYIMSIPLRTNFNKIENNVYLNKDNSLTPDEVREITAQAKERVTEFYGDTHCLETTTIIICDDKNISDKIGEKDTNTFLFPTKKDYICLSNDYFNVDVVAHELTHAELHSYISADTQRNLPVWFDEGLATQNDYREKYSYENWVTKTDNGKKATPLEDMDSHSEFQCKDENERQFHYLCAKHEISEWLDKHSVQELLELVKAVNNGEDFYTLYNKA
ncbi:hypothetical protein [Ruminococcus albus]|uniref:Peptidase MA superfamily protein n=1 Tax=Ruminococcus albus TaxID=1264 RepID=A0A1I1F895_RUMAL|nr:hypothetical protein [Ruminococcus albus]SFB93928.1 hypothetical protein SAMN02910406_00859 [Ruminococcus albus]